MMHVGFSVCGGQLPAYFTPPSYPPPSLQFPPLQGGNVTLTFLLETVGCNVLSCSFSASALCQR